MQVEAEAEAEIVDNAEVQHEVAHRGRIPQVNQNVLHALNESGEVYT